MKHEKLHVLLLVIYLAVCCIFFVGIWIASKTSFQVFFFFVSTLIFVYAFFHIRKKYVEQKERNAVLQLVNEKEHQKNSETREFMHQYKSNMIALEGLAEQPDTSALKEYIHSLVKDFELVWNKSDYFSLKPVHNPALYQLLVSEFQYAEQKKVKLSFVTNEISDYLLRNQDLISIVSILSENAIEAAASSQEKRVTIRILQDEEGVEYTFSNTVGHEVDVLNIFEEGYSTKEHKSGVGLSYVKRILKKYENADYFVDYNDTIFRFYLKLSMP